MPHPIKSDDDDSNHSDYALAPAKINPDNITPNSLSSVESMSLMLALEFSLNS